MRLTRTRRYMLLRNAAKDLLPRRFPEHGPREDDPGLELAVPVLLAWPPDVPKPHVGLVRDVDDYPYWTKYRRFLQANDIPFEMFDIHRSTWLHDASKFDMIVWRPMSYPHELEECRRKFHILETDFDMLCCPSIAEVLLYEDKIMQYELLRHHGLPVIETFVSHSETEVLEYLKTCDYPLAWKITTGSGSLGVELVRSQRSARRHARRVFDFAGRRTYWPHVGQKNYVYLQRFVPEASWDMRVIVIGSMVFGYFRDVPKGEYRASGMNTVRWGVLPEEAMRLARRVAQALDLPNVAVDLLADRSDETLRIIELSNFVQVQTPDQLRLDSVAGAYVFDGPGDEHRFVSMSVWPQELTLRLVLEKYWLGGAEGPGGGLRR